ncbi:MAG: hypothetical protein RI897_4024 [Verrucomicrobiota bacterium]
MSGHDVGIHVDGVDGVHDRDSVGVTEDIEDIAGVAFGAVGHEDFVIGDLHAVVTVIVLGDGCAEELVTLFGAIATEGGALAHFVGSFMQRVDGGLGQGFCDVADPAADEFTGGVGVGFGECFDAPGDFGEEVAGFEFQVVIVDLCHKENWVIGH